MCISKVLSKKKVKYCPYCSSENIVQVDSEMQKHLDLRETFECKSCKQYFVVS